MSEWDDTTSVAEPSGLAAAGPGERDRAYFIVLAGSNVGEMYKIAGDQLVLGRGRDCDIQIVDEGVSRLHARIRIDGEGIRVEDLGSRNGTFANGAKIASHVLRDGDKVQIGRTTILKFSYHDRLDESFQRQMYDSALRDSLTKAYNKRYFDERLESEFRFAVRHDVPLTVLLLDLDHFKPINDTHGHLAGDHALADFAAAMQKTVRNEDVFARYGGEEFAVISRAIPLDNARKFAERLCRVTEALTITHEGTAIPLTVSIGVATWPDASVATALELLAAADRALYDAKARGRNCFAVYDPGIPDEDTAPAV
jgi:two-component system, cell cycle response regulator